MLWQLSRVKPIQLSLVEVVLEELGLRLMDLLVLTHNLHQLFLLAVGLEAEVGHQQITVETVVLEVGVRWLLVPVEQVTHHFAHLLKEITEAAALIAELSMAGVAVVVLEELGLMEAVLGFRVMAAQVFQMTLAARHSIMLVVAVVVHIRLARLE